jgi:hypothetical protein
VRRSTVDAMLPHPDREVAGQNAASPVLAGAVRRALVGFPRARSIVSFYLYLARATCVFVK